MGKMALEGKLLLFGVEFCKILNLMPGQVNSGEIDYVA
jgi:hypothetical protein